MECSLYVDELGESVPFRHAVSPYFILTGCIVENYKRQEVIERLNHIKFKFWNRTDVILHSTKIGRKERDFTIFDGNPRLFSSFTNDLKDFFASCPISIICVVVDLEDAHLQNWVQQTVLTRSYRMLFENYIRLLVAKRAKGGFIQEASTTIQDITIYQQFFRYQARGLPGERISASNVKDHLTDLSFITKKSSDSLSQLADLLGYGMKLETLVIRKGKKVRTLRTYQKMARKAAKGHLLHISPGSSRRKARIYSNLDPYKIIP